MNTRCNDVRARAHVGSSIAWLNIRDESVFYVVLGKPLPWYPV
jgi:hypothetical protein